MDIFEASCIGPSNIHKSFVLGSAVGLLGIVIYHLVRKKELSDDDSESSTTDEHNKKLDTVMDIDNIAENAKKTMDIIRADDNSEKFIQKDGNLLRDPSRTSVRMMVEFFERRGESN